MIVPGALFLPHQALFLSSWTQSKLVYQLQDNSAAEQACCQKRVGQKSAGTKACKTRVQY